MLTRNLGRLSEKATSLFLCDMQEKFRPNIMFFPQIIEVSRRMAELAKILEMPTVVTEQYPKASMNASPHTSASNPGVPNYGDIEVGIWGPNAFNSKNTEFFPEPITKSATWHLCTGLGPTVSELGDLSHAKKFEKTCFSMVLPEVEQELMANKRKSIILCGIETQACILRTTTDLLEKDYQVHVVADAVSSRSQVDRLFALATMRQMGAFITTSETVLLQLLGDAMHPKFREAQKLIMTSAPDSGLLQAFGQT